MKRLLFVVVALSAVPLGCGDDKKKKVRGSFPVPSVSEVVDEAAPSGLKSGAGLRGMDLATMLESVATAAGMEEFVKTKVFQEDTTGTIPGAVYYRYFVDVLDRAMDQTETRISATELEEGETRCYTESPVEVSQSLVINGETINWSAKYNCWETQDIPTADRGGKQIMAFGKDDDHFYLNYLTRTSEEYTNSGDGEILVFAKATTDSNEADVIYLGQAYGGPPGNVGMKPAFSRIIANKETGAFSFLLAFEPSGAALCTIFVRSNGEKIYIEARADSMGACVDVADMEPGSGKCFAAADMAATTGCEGISTYPSQFLFTGTVDDQNLADIKETSASLVAFDFTAAGVGELARGVETAP